MDFDLRLLRHCRALAEEGSFAKASRALHITQPALSRSIRDLEERVGIRIFDRTRARVVPTDLGSVFIQQAGALLAQAESLDREVALLKGSASGALKIGAGTFPSVLFMGPALASFMARHPGVAIQVSTDNWVNLLASLRRRELDIAVGRPPEVADAADLDVRMLVNRQGYAFVRPGHPLLALGAPTLDDVVAHPLAMSARVGAGIAELLRKTRGDTLGRHGIPDFAAESFAILKAVTRRCDHVMIATAEIVTDEVARGELVTLPFIDPRISSHFAVMRLRGRTLPPVVEDLVASIVATDASNLTAHREATGRPPHARRTAKKSPTRPKVVAP